MQFLVQAPVMTVRFVLMVIPEGFPVLQREVIGAVLVVVPLDDPQTPCMRILFPEPPPPLPPEFPLEPPVPPLEPPPLLVDIAVVPEFIAVFAAVVFIAIF